MSNSHINQLDYYGKLKEFLEKNPTETELDFTTNEINWYDNFIERLQKETHSKQDWEIEYLQNCIKYREYFIDKKRQCKTEVAIDSFDESQISAVQKVIFLNELGLIDKLRKEKCFISSVNNLAVIISIITGEKQKTIQPYLNYLLSNTGAENNNPYKSLKTVEKVKNKLIQLGFNPK